MTRSWGVTWVLLGGLTGLAAIASADYNNELYAQAEAVVSACPNAYLLTKEPTT